MENNKTTTLVKTEANRKNALKSTGPKTLEGKSIIRWNALKHGLLSKEITIKAGDGKESKAEFKVLLSELREDLQPEVSSKRCWLRRLLSVTGGSGGCSGAKPERYARSWIVSVGGNSSSVRSRSTLKRNSCSLINIKITS